MPRINVLEFRYAATQDGEWTEPTVDDRELTRDAPRDWCAPVFDEELGTWEQSRVVPYERVEVREVREPPDSGRWVLGRYAEGGWRVVRYVYVGQPYWFDAYAKMDAPDEWRELPEVPK